MKEYCEPSGLTLVKSVGCWELTKHEHSHRALKTEDIGELKSRVYSKK